MELRKAHKDEFEKVHGVKLGFMSAFVAASTKALIEIPAVNAYIDDDAKEIVYRDYCDVSVAVASPNGLVVPVLRNTEAILPIAPAPMAESAASIEGQLWLVFTFYTIRGNASDPERLTAAALSRLCKDCQMYSKAVHGNAISERQVEVACAALRRRSVDRARQGAVKQALGDSDARRGAEVYGRGRAAAAA
ncbi:hypothetical protein JL722_13638 [Aureococcus anophagefferens]|nr:hypothetical protein JL722_13638 [Aureococcus anophagefferens]